jgi:hypothetical protein
MNLSPAGFGNTAIVTFHSCDTVNIGTLWAIDEVFKSLWLWMSETEVILQEI